ALEHAAVQVEIHERHDITQLEAEQPLLEAIKLACRVGGPHQRAYGSTADDVGMDPRVAQYLQHSDVCPPARRTTAQGKADDGLARGGMHGDAVSSSGRYVRPARTGPRQAG